MLNNARTACQIIAVLGLTLAACTDSGTPTLEPAPDPGGQQLATDTYKLQPGEEKYMCYQFTSPDEKVAVTHVQTISMLGIHHMVVYQNIGDKEPEAPHECGALIKTSWLPIFGNNTGSRELTLPTSTGFMVEAHTQYVLQLHLQNSGDKPLDIRAGVNFTYDHTPDSLTPAGMFALGSFSIDVPPQTLDYTIPITNCAPNRPMNVFAVMPHMHKLGTKLEVTHNGAAFYNIDPWVFGNQPIDTLVQTIAPTDTFNMTCHYDNHSDQDVMYGESSDNEMCFFVMFYYPYTGLDGCINS